MERQESAGQGMRNGEFRKTGQNSHCLGLKAVEGDGLPGVLSFCRALVFCFIFASPLSLP